MGKIKVAIVGDYNPAFASHIATSKSIEHVSEKIKDKVTYDWISTNDLKKQTTVLSKYQRIWIAPAPYLNERGLLNSIEYARTKNVPLIGTGEGFVYSIIEFCSRVLGIENQKLEIVPENQDELVIVKSKDNQQTLTTVDIRIKESSKSLEIYKIEESKEMTNCDYSLNQNYFNQVEEAGMHIAAYDNNNDAQLLELPEHKYFILTKFLPQITSAPGKSHPLIKAFIKPGI
ncbi:MAG: hypothetical protein MI922_22105 [Bacteroidales bacterium]|nr:hypothetical protein [Bacteroidales bacterium]